jgi:hypothetical protein
VGDFLSVIFSIPGLQLNRLSIGRLLDTSTALSVLTDIPKDSSMLSCLKILNLMHTCEEPSADSELAEESSTPNQTFAEFSNFTSKSPED